MTRHPFLPSLVLTLVLAVACGGKSPTSPSPAQSPAETPAPSPAPSVPAGSATLAGQVVAGAASLGASMPLGLAGVTVSVAGTSISTVADGAGLFSLSNVPGGDQRIEFHGNGANATVTIAGIAEQEHIDVTVAVTGSTAEVVEQERVTGAEAQLEGTITAKSEAARTLDIRGVTVKVPAGVPIRHGATSLTFANLHAGDRVHVKGAKDSAGVTASQVEVQHGADTPGNGNGGNGGNGDEAATTTGTGMMATPARRRSRERRRG